jgi:hypothetical protein
MNTELTKAMAEAIIERWDEDKGILTSEEIYQEFMARGVQVPEGDMHEIFVMFEKAGIISGTRNKHPTAHGQHGAMIIGTVDTALLKEIEFD